MGVVALTSCQIVDGLTSSAPASPRDRLDVAVAEEPAASPSAYPSLYTVPPRPRLSYSVEQRRTIVEGLVADRELARYTDQVVRYRSGQSTLPPPPAPPREMAAIDTEGLLEPDPEAAPEPDAPPLPEAPSPYDDDAGFGGFDDDEDEDTLDSFVDDLARDPLQEQADEVGVPGAATEPVEEDESGGGLLDWLGGLLGRAERDAPAPPAALAAVPAMQPTPVVQGTIPPRAARPDAGPPEPLPDGPGIAIGEEGVAIEGAPANGTARAAGAADVAVRKATVEVARQAEPRVAAAIVAGVPAASIGFAPHSAELPAGAGAKLEQVLARAKAEGAMIRILGEARVPALALDRARAVGLALVRLGAGATDLEMTLAPDATGDQARLLLAGPGLR